MAEPAKQPQSGDGMKLRVSRKDLPLACPTPATELWNMHPRVFLPIEATGHAVCPYCGAEYELID